MSYNIQGAATARDKAEQLRAEMRDCIAFERASAYALFCPPPRHVDGAGCNGGALYGASGFASKIGCNGPFSRRRRNLHAFVRPWHP